MGNCLDGIEIAKINLDKRGTEMTIHFAIENENASAILQEMLETINENPDSILRVDSIADTLSISVDLENYYPVGCLEIFCLNYDNKKGAISIVKKTVMASAE